MIDAAIELARPKRLMAGMDEVRGINRDSRSRRLGMGNGRIFAHAMNRLAACVRRSAERRNLSVTPLFWADMVSPLHNGVLARSLALSPDSGSQNVKSVVVHC